MSNKKRRIEHAMTEHEDIPSDVLGSYTGTPDDGIVPEQDADDL